MDVPFLERLQDLIEAGVDARTLRAAADALEATGAPLTLRIVPFVPGRRPADEAAHPGLGSSEEVAVLLADAEDPACILYTLSAADVPGVSVRAALSSSGWEEREVAIERIGDERFLFVLHPERELADDQFTFDHQFSQQVGVRLRACWHGVPVAGDETSILICDLRRCGSLYQRLLDDLVVPDTARQAADAGVENPGPAYHPWYPVLVIGSEKAALYTRALIQDITGSGQHLSDPGWLMRVGLYLEFLTFLGICEAVDVELLSPAERAAYESDGFDELRSRVDGRAWRQVWNLREIAFARRGLPRLGPVAAANLLAKKRATLQFLEVHHADLRHAIELAGRNHHNAQETWQRVFRDAERAVLSRTPAAFPELAHLSEQVRDFVLWHRRGRFELGRAVRLPRAISAVVADQDGLFGSACTQYRRSMNEVADWAKRRGLMDHTGHRCVPRQVSLLEASVNQPARIATLQRRDGYGPDLEVPAELPAAFQRPAAEIEGLLAAVPLFALLPPEEVRTLARTARPLTLGPTERLVIQDQAGGSLFVIAEGEVEVVLRRDGGADVVVDTMGKGAVVGEMSLLTHQPRSATVRAVDGAVAYEIGARQYGPCLRRHPELVTDLAALMSQRLAERRERLDAYDAEHEHGAIVERIRSAFSLAQPARRAS
jgi:CRP-like cAMP-binding protein